MQTLQQDHPDIYRIFLEGYHVLRRRDRYWAGLSTDLVIEQVLMRSVKTSGGLTRGRGTTETQRAQWLLSMPSCANVNTAMQNLTGVGFYTSEQHKEMSYSRKKRDKMDTLKILSFLQERNPFADDKSLRNIETGVTAESSVNVDKAKEIGMKIIEYMAGKNILNLYFQKIKSL
ncbi:unnamed protein product [Mytilus coruscus]|uniref:Uncharacterized protein n=1 Tax=Mytilus coruscus TaxID=42192 RepID=A0A6J8AA80_MYTCO|nr:unnamed protein product [Mytilus coruscus]